jgi:hypothetical protein
MNTPKLRKLALVGALAAVATTAGAARDPYYRTTLVPSYGVITEPRRDAATVPVTPTPTPAAPVAVEHSLAPHEEVVTTRQAAPHVRSSAPRSRITIEERRLSEDERIQLAVMDRIAADPRLSGKIQVQSRNRVVTLSGWTRTAGQAWHAQSDARSVLGVRYVENAIRPRVGGSV